jgi:Flp pilus assembly protein TadD
MPAPNGFRPAVLLLVAASLFSFSCSREAPPARPTRLAILRFENLTSDPRADWIGRAIPEVMRTALAADRGLYAIPANRLHAAQAAAGARPLTAPGISTERPAALALAADRIGYGQYSVEYGRLRARLTIEDAATGRVAETIEASAPEGDVLSVAASLAGRLSTSAVAYPLRDPQALRLYAQALESAPGEGIPLLENAIAAAPDYGAAYRLLAEIKLQARDAPGALRTLESALARASSMPPVERARIELAAATLKGDAAGRGTALKTLTGLEPNDPQTWQAFAEDALTREEYPVAVQAFRRELEIEPADADAWNRLGYAAAYAGDVNTAADAIGKYRALRPGDPNPDDSLGEVYLMNGRFADAEKLFLATARRDPLFLGGTGFLKAALARLMAGDTEGASGIFHEYVEARRKAGDPLAEFHTVEWLWIVGRRKEALAQMEQLAGAAATNSRDVAAHACAQLAIWNLQLGNRDRARQWIAQATPLSGAGTAPVVGVVGFLTQPSASAAEWAARADRSFPNAPPGSLKDLLLGYALLLEKDFPAAATAISRFGALSPATSADPAPALALAWAQVESGQAEQAAAALRLNPIPPPTGFGPFFSFYFPRIYYLRGRLAQQQKRPDEARANFRRFLELSGPDPLAWGEEQKAR